MKIIIYFFSFKNNDFCSSPRYLCNLHKDHDNFLSFLQDLWSLIFKFVTLIHLQLIFVFEMRQWLIYAHIFFLICSSSNLSSFCWKYFPFIHWIALYLYWKSTDITLALDSVVFYHCFSLFISISHCLDYYIFIVILKIRNCKS